MFENLYLFKQTSVLIFLHNIPQMKGKTSAIAKNLAIAFVLSACFDTSARRLKKQRFPNKARKRRDSSPSPPNGHPFSDVYIEAPVLNKEERFL
ncbi:MAG: hypothetical protein ACLRNQ_02210 [Flavonifractor plautii]